MSTRWSSRRSKKFSSRSSGLLSTSSSGLPKWRQSPVDLCKTATWTKKFPPLYLTNYWSDEGSATMTNTGKTDLASAIEDTNKTHTLPTLSFRVNVICAHSKLTLEIKLHCLKRGHSRYKFSVSIEFSDRALPSMRGGPLGNDEFQFMNVQFRWGAENSLGAEHSVNGLWYSMEAQIMHWNTRYGSVERCFDKPDGIAILSYLMQVVGCPGIPDNPSLSPITDNLSKIKIMGSNTTIPPDCLLWMLEACMGHGYYTYPGSLTTPPYNECVIWMISSTVTKISFRQIDAFRSLYDGRLEHILENHRQQQPLRRRRILFATDEAVA